MPNRILGTLLSLAGPDGGTAATLKRDVYRSGLTPAIVKARPEETEHTFKVTATFDAATALTGIKFWLRRNVTGGQGVYLVRQGGTTLMEHTLDATADKDLVITFQTDALAGIDEGSIFEAEGIGGATKAGDSIVITGTAIAPQR